MASWHFVFGVFGGVWLQARVVFSLPIQRVFLLSHFASPTFQAMSWLLATAALVGAVPAPHFGAVWQPHAPEANELVVAIDVDLCSNKATFTNSRCPSVTGQRWDDEHVVECQHIWLPDEFLVCMSTPSLAMFLFIHFHADV